MTPKQTITAQIGTDIKLNVKLVGDDLAHKINIQSVEACFVNTTLQQQMKDEYEYDKAHFKFIRRYPCEPLVNDYLSTAYCLNNSGAYCYRAIPVNVYAGYGVEPFGKKHCHHMPHVDDKSICKATIYYTRDRSTVQIYFPADIQKATGTYDLVIHAKIYDPSYEYGHIRTISISYEGLVILNGSVEDLPDGISDIIIGNDQSPSVDVTDLFVYKGDLQGTNLDLTLSDESPVSIDMSNEFGWHSGD